MINYQAPNPYPKKESSFSFFRFLFSLFSSESVGKLVLPAQTRKSLVIKPEVLQEISVKHQVLVDQGFVYTHDGAALATIEITPAKQMFKPSNEKHYIVKFNGNYDLYENHLEEFAILANKCNATIVAFNYRNVGQSSKTAPRSIKDIEIDGIAEVQRLIAAGVKSKRILLDGISLGGVIATTTANYFHKHKKPVDLFNDRSLSQVSSAAYYLIERDLSLENDLLQTSFESSTSGILHTTGWEENASAAYQNIPNEFKAYMVVGKQSKKTGSKGDGVIHDFASLHHGVRKADKGATCKKVFSLYQEGHNVSRADLVSKADPTKTGEDIFIEFAMRNRRS